MLYQGANQLTPSSCLTSAKQCVVKGLQASKRPQKRRVQACQSSINVTPILEGGWSTAGKWRPGTVSLVLPRCCALGKGWQEMDAKIWLWRGPAEQTPGFCLACLGTVSAKLVLHPGSQSFSEKRASAALLGTADFEWVCLPLWATWTCEAWAHSTHEDCRSCELSVLPCSQHGPQPWLPLPQQAVELCPGSWHRRHLSGWTLLLPQDKQHHCEPGTHAPLKGQVIPSTFPSLCLSMQELRRAGLLGSWDQAVLSCLSLGRTQHSPQTLVVSDKSPRMAALWNLSASTSTSADANWVSIMLH